MFELQLSKLTGLWHHFHLLAVNISTGSSLQDQSGNITVRTGLSSKGNGSNIILHSGQSLDEEAMGGSTVISAGNGVGGGGSLVMSGGGGTGPK